MNVTMVINSGSTSLKFGIYDLEDNLKLVYSGMIDGMGNKPKLVIKNSFSDKVYEYDWASKITHLEGLDFILSWLQTSEIKFDIKSVGHRVVLGGEKFSEPSLIDDETTEYLESLSVFVPSHQPFNVAGIKAIKAIYPNVPQVAVFDSSFHQTMPEIAKTYALPKEIRDLGVRHWGFHGISYDYINRQLTKLSPESTKSIVAHLGGGASITAIKDGKCVETSMQFSGLTGLPMATRSGDVPVDVAIYLLKNGYSVDELETTLYKKSGLFGLSGEYNDMRQISSSTRESDKLAVEHFIYSLVKFIGSYASVLEGLDTLVFTAGIGENSAIVRKGVCDRLKWLGVELDDSENTKNSTVISKPNSKVKVFVIPTNEEIMIAQHTLRLSGA